jgi:hypothetical protein
MKHARHYYLCITFKRLHCILTCDSCELPPLCLNLFSFRITELLQFCIRFLDMDHIQMRATHPNACNTFLSVTFLSVHHVQTRATLKTFANLTKKKGTPPCSYERICSLRHFMVGRLVSGTFCGLDVL